MIRIVAVWVCSMAAVTSMLGELITAPADQSAPTNRLSPAPDGDRFLFIVDTSSSTKKFNLAAREAVVDMIYKGLGGRMTNGDTFGVWTVGSTVRAGQFPMQVWSAARPLELASLAGQYVRAQPIEGKANLPAMFKMLHSVITAVKDVNVFLITDGDTEVKGTQLDQALNSLIEDKQTEARRLRQPMVVTLVARKGRVAAYSVTMAGEKIILPPRPPRVAAVKKSGADSKQRSTSKRSIIITKSSAQPPSSPSPARSAPTSATAPASDQTVSPAANVSSPETNSIAEKSPALVPAISPEPPPSTTNSIASSPGPLLAARRVPPSPLAPPTNVFEKQEAPTQENPQDDPPTAEKIPTIELLERPVSIWAETAPRPPGNWSATSPAAVGPVVATNVDPSGIATLLQQPLLVSARERATNRLPIPASPATATPASAWSVQTLLILGSALLLIAMLLLLLVIRHQRRASQLSLITRSMDRR